MMQAQIPMMQTQMLLPFAWSGISAGEEFGLLPPPLWGRGGEGGGAVK